MNVEQVDERIAACVRSLDEHWSKVSDVLAQERIDELLELRKRLEEQGQ